MHIFSPKKGAVVIALTMLPSAGTFALIAVVSLPETAHTQEGSWQQVGSVSKSVSCKPPETERKNVGPQSRTVVYDAGGSSEKIRVTADASASVESCSNAAQSTPSGNADQSAGAALAALEETDPPGDGDSTGGGGSGGSGSGSGSGGSSGGSGSNNGCETKKANAYASYGIEAFGNSSSIYANSTIGKSQSNPYDSDSYSQTFSGRPTGEVSFTQTDQSLYCHAYYGSGANASFSITVYEWEPEGGGGDDVIKPPIADDDSASVDLCTAKSFTLDVLDNDKDPDDENLRIDSVGNPSGGGTASGVDTDGDGLDDAVSYTPSSGPSNVNFDYTVSDGGDGTDTATTTVDVNGTKGSCTGSISVQVEDQNGNPVSVDNVDINFSGNSSCPSESNTSGYTCTVDLSDTCKNGSYSISDSDYNVVEQDKQTSGDDNTNSPTQTQLCY